MIRTRWAVLLLTLLGVVNVCSLYAQLSATAHEPYLRSAGMTWLKTGALPADDIHPPLAQVTAALPLYVLDRLSGRDVLSGLSAYQSYITQLVFSRLAQLPYYILSCWIVFIWSRQLFGKRAAAWSLFSFVLLSTVTAYGALATTDMAFTAFFMCALKCGVDWLRHPTNRVGVMMGVSVGLMVASDSFGLMFLPAAMLAIMLMQTMANRGHATFLLPIGNRHLATAVFFGFMVMLFALGAFCHYDYTPILEQIERVQKLDEQGVALWLFKPLYDHAVWYFFPVVYFFKTPLPFHIAAMIGAALIIQRMKSATVSHVFPLLAAYAVMLVSMTGHVDLGVRQVLVLYPMLAIPAGYGLYWLEHSGGWKRLLGMVLITWQFVGFMITHPNHLSYFNELAGRHPEHISLGSDFDWGQDVFALDEALQKRNAWEVVLCANRNTLLSATQLLHAKILECANGPFTGWIAVSRAERVLAPEHFTWLEGMEAVQPVGSTLNLYFVPIK